MAIFEKKQRFELRTNFMSTVQAGIINAQFISPYSSASGKKILQIEMGQAICSY